jgi:hypothetical protein
MNTDQQWQTDHGQPWQPCITVPYAHAYSTTATFHLQKKWGQWQSSHSDTQLLVRGYPQTIVNHKHQKTPYSPSLPLQWAYVLHNTHSLQILPMWELLASYSIYTKVQRNLQTLQDEHSQMKAINDLSTSALCGNTLLLGELLTIFLNP